LNLTFGTLSASCKYIAASHQSGSTEDHGRSKPGYFASEAGIVKEIQERAGTGDARNPLTYLVEAADDLVYSVADVEDAVKKGVASWDAIEEILRSLNDESVDIAIERMGKILRAGEDALPSGLPGDIFASAFR